MVQKSQGSRHGTRKKLKKKEKQKKSPASKITKQFEKEEVVHIDMDPSIQKGMPHPRFDGRTGRILEKRGRAFVVEVTDKNSKKKLTIRPEHLKKQGEKK